MIMIIFFILSASLVLLYPVPIICYFFILFCCVPSVRIHNKYYCTYMHCTFWHNSTCGHQPPAVLCQHGHDGLCAKFQLQIVVLLRYCLMKEPPSQSRPFTQLAQFDISEPQLIIVWRRGGKIMCAIIIQP